MKLKTVTKADNVSLIFGEWFDRTYGNTYYDVKVYIGDKVGTVKWGYGYNAGDKQSIDEALAALGYRVRKGPASNRFAPYAHIRIDKHDKKKRELFKTTGWLNNAY